MAFEDKQAHPHDGDVVQRLADRLSGVAHVHSVFGDPVQRNGTTVIPVANIRYGFGGGAGRRPRMDQEGTGGGGSVRVTPIGYIEMTDDGAAFRRIRSASPLGRALGVVAALSGITIVARGIAGALLPLFRRRRARTLIAAMSARERRRLRALRR